MEVIKQQFNTVGSSFFYHHTLTTAQCNDYCIGPEAHRQYELLYLISGRLTYLIEGRAYEVHPGDMILISPNDIHTLQVGNGTDYERMVLHFNMELLTQFLRNTNAQCPDFQWDRFAPIIPGDVCRQYGLQALLVALITCAEESRYKSPYAIAKTMELVMQLDKVFATRKLSQIQPITVDPMIQRMIDFINANMTQPISLDEMAAHLYISKSTLCHRFRAYMNVTINRYITVKKMYYAAELIQKGMSAAEAGLAVGYSNYTTFFYNYKQIIGTYPSAGKTPGSLHRNGGEN